MIQVSEEWVNNLLQRVERLKDAQEAFDKDDSKSIARLHVAASTLVGCASVIKYTPDYIRMKQMESGLEKTGNPSC